MHFGKNKKNLFFFLIEKNRFKIELSSFNKILNDEREI
jgi:helix-turn-helix protein